MLVGNCFLQRKEVPRYVCTYSCDPPPDSRIACDSSTVLLDAIQQSEHEPSSLSPAAASPPAAPPVGMKRARSEDTSDFI